MYNSGSVGACVRAYVHTAAIYFHIENGTDLKMPVYSITINYADNY